MERGPDHEDGMKINGMPTMIDLFAGCGGLSLGMEKAGFFPLFVNELSPDALETYLLNRDRSFPHLRRKYRSNDIKSCIANDGFFDDLLSGLSREFGRDFRSDTVDLLTGGPPCQGYSGIGLRRSYSVDKAQLPSNHLYQDMAYFIHRIRPKIFLFENVEGLLRSRWTKDGAKGEIFEHVLETFRSIPDYQVRFKLVYGKDYRVPQNRPRVLIVGLRSDIYPSADHADAVEAGFLPKPIGMYPHIEEIFSDLIDPTYENGGLTKFYPKDPSNDFQIDLRTDPLDGSVLGKGARVSEHEYSKHKPHVVEKFRHMIDNRGEIPERFQTKKFAQRVLPHRWGNQGPNITACSLPDDFVHYVQPRSLTVREWARLQTFPDWYQFSGKRTTGGIRRAGNPRESIFDREVPKYTQIGNAVAVNMATEIGRHFRKILGA